MFSPLFILPQNSTNIKSFCIISVFSAVFEIKFKKRCIIVYKYTITLLCRIIKDIEIFRKIVYNQMDRIYIRIKGCGINYSESIGGIMKGKVLIAVLCLAFGASVLAACGSGSDSSSSKSSSSSVSVASQSKSDKSSETAESKKEDSSAQSKQQSGSAQDNSAQGSSAQGGSQEQSSQSGQDSQTHQTSNDDKQSSAGQSSSSSGSEKSQASGSKESSAPSSKQVSEPSGELPIEYDEYELPFIPN